MQLIFLFFWKEMDKAYLNAPIWQSMQIFENFIAQKIIFWVKTKSKWPHEMSESTKQGKGP